MKRLIFWKRIKSEGKLLIFSLLMVPSVVLLFGVLPAIFLGFGIYMMKKNPLLDGIGGQVSRS